MCAPLQEASAKLRPLTRLPVCVQEELEAFEKRQQRGGRRSKRRGRREEVEQASCSGGWKRSATFLVLPLGGVLLSVAAYYLMSVQ